jgi:hypothetical protein
VDVKVISHPREANQKEGIKKYGEKSGPEKDSYMQDRAHQMLVKLKD